MVETHRAVPASDVRGQLAEHGYFLLHEAGAGVLVEVLEELGRVVHVEEVVIAPSSASLVKSDRALALHTDHHRADLIVWYCIAQSDRGGDTILVDARTVVGSLPREVQTALLRVQLQEHSVFASDDERHPILVWRDGCPRIYYSYWLGEGLGEHERAAFEAFASAVDRAPRVTMRLAPGDILCIDNTRMLHGRGAIEGTRQRHLRRYWLEASAR